jgi:alpha-N-arabinofuranosidase
MRRVRRLWLPVSVLTLLSVTVASQQRGPTVIAVQADKPGAEIAKTMFGVFYEDINFAADGGLYPERVKNRSFEFPDPLMGWYKSVGEGGTFSVRTDGAPSDRNGHFVRIDAPGDEPFGIMNFGFRGIGVREKAEYRFSVLARQAGGSAAKALRVELQDGRGNVLGSARVSGFTERWQRYTASVAPARTDSRARLALFVEGPGTLDVDVVSLFPVDTFKGRQNGLRKDLAQLLADLKPGFLRFPGGCIVEGRYLDLRYDWKATIGDPAERDVLVNRWNDEFMHRPAADYYQSFGLGFYEYFQLAEDIGAEPLPIVNCGMACQFNSGQLAPLDQLDPFIQDALDLIEFANGGESTVWGRKRAAMGHPAPFALKYVGIGNEQWGPDYVARYAEFQKVLRAKHPEIELVAAAGPGADGERFDYLWKELRRLETDLVDEHYYRPPSWFLENAARYDSYPRTGPKVFAGEYAAHAGQQSEGPGRNIWEAALAEAAFMTGLERNADLVRMASYAPLLAHVEAWQWAPNLIWFDNLRSFGTPNYYVQQVFGTNRGTRVLPVTANGAPPAGEAGLYASAAVDDGAKEIVVKVVNTVGFERTVRIDLGSGAGTRRGTAFVMRAEPGAQNTFTEPTRVAPVQQPLTVEGSAVDRVLPGHSLTVLRIPSAP